ncbi:MULTISPECIES: SPOR domain-containing protein [unclassified Vibrio]|uniref:SPOR domain-containing protein n=1 Tax=Vibrio sp. HB236076 TaxID=3232307 RepID=A0AB39HEE3_9VIBR|nr:SPOR domain-containing protein [Vibrio sp. HB161653]MDP5255790.1 SPOR domain-containing protein [Vibrio sp. HB161653]
MANKDYVRRGQAPKKTNKKTAKPKQTRPKKPWRSLLVAAIAVSLFGYGLYTLSQSPEPATTPEPVAVAPQKTAPSRPASASNASLPPVPEQKWDYIDDLPNRQIEVTPKEQQVSKIPYVMQCGAFITMEQAQTRKVNIAFVGLSSRIKKKEGSKWYRVILGPYKFKRDAERDRHKLQRHKIEPCAIWKENL